MWRIWVRRRGGIGSWWGKPEGRNHWGDLGVDGWIILGWISRRWDVSVWTGLAWPRIETGGGRLWVRYIRVPWNARNFLTSCKPFSFSRRTLHHSVNKCGKGNELIYLRRCKAGRTARSRRGDLYQNNKWNLIYRVFQKELYNFESV